MLKLKNYKIKFENKTIEFGDVSILENEFVGICGEIGCGKTSFLESIFGYEFKGAIEYELGELRGVDLKLKEDVYGYLSYCPQFAQDSLNPKLTLYEHISLIKVGNKTIISEEAIKNYMRELNLSPLLLDSYPYMLSGGQKQRIVILLGLIKAPSIFVLDEPSSAIDIINLKIITGLLLKLKGTMTIIMVSHNQNLLNKICDRIIKL